MTNRQIIALALAAGLAAAPASAATPETAQYDLRMTMRVGDAAPTYPRLTVYDGATARVEIANESYDLRLTATPDSASGRVALASHITYWTPAGLRGQGGEIDLRADGETGTIAFPSTDPATGATREVRIEVSVQPLRD